MLRIPQSTALLVAMAAVSATDALADVAVRTGEHPGFTRLVVDDPGIVGWQIGRSDNGYELRITPEGKFDLSGVFRSIGRARIASVDAKRGGRLLMGLGCDCHVEPYEARPGVIVMDIHDGPAPAGSPFERRLSSDNSDELADLRPKARPSTGADAAKPAEVTTITEAPKPPVVPYDWKAMNRTATEVKIELEMPSPTLDAMRASLVEQLSRGAAAGAVDFVVPPPSPTPEKTTTTAPDPVEQIQILPSPGFDASATERPTERITADGSDCVADDRLDVAAWGADEPVSQHIATALAGLTGEFDQPQAEALRTAVRYYIYLGFGAEAQQLLSAFRSDDPDRALWEGMAKSMDGESLPGGAFDKMASCDTSAALWSVLADPPATSRYVNGRAVLRTFSAMPPHLRRLLGPKLIEDTLARGDGSNARALRDAMMRAPGDPGLSASLADVRVEIAEGTGRPKEDLVKLSSQTGPSAAEALALLVEKRVAAGETIPATDVTTLASMLAENKGSDLGRRLGHAYRLALAATGDYKQAFVQHDIAPDSDPEIWAMLGKSGADSAVLTYAVLGPDQPLPPVPAETRRALADRLLDLGLPGPASRWIPGDPDSPEDRVLAARVDSFAGKPEDRPVISAPRDPAATARPAPSDAALAPVADAPVGAAAPSPSSAPSDQSVDLWAEVAKAASRPQAETVGTDGALARGRALVSESAAARSKIEALLRQTGP